MCSIIGRGRKSFEIAANFYFLTSTKRTEIISRRRIALEIFRRTTCDGNEGIYKIDFVSRSFKLLFGLENYTREMI